MMKNPKTSTRATPWTHAFEIAISALEGCWAPLSVMLNAEPAFRTRDGPWPTVIQVTIPTS